MWVEKHVTCIHDILTHVFRALYPPLHSYTCIQSFLSTVTVTETVDLGVSMSVCEVRGVWERVNRGAPPSKAISEACDSHKDLLMSSHMGRKRGATDRCQVGISRCRGHSNVRNKTKVKAVSVVQAALSFS